MPEENVSIVSMKEVAARRTASLDLTTQVRVNDDTAATSLVSSWSMKTLNLHLKNMGLTLVSEATLASEPVKKPKGPMMKSPPEVCPSILAVTRKRAAPNLRLP